MTEQDRSDDTEMRIEVSADKPGRYVTVEVTQPTDSASAEKLPWAVTLTIEGGFGNDEWTWLAPGEAREVAVALLSMAEQADARNARDPRAKND